MKYEIGDRVVVLITDEEGTIVDILNDDMVLIEVRGLRFPVYTDQIDFPYFKMFTKGLKKPEQKKIFIGDIKKEKNASRISPKGTGVGLTFFPVFDKDVFNDDIVEKIKIYLVNDNTESYRFKYKLILSGHQVFELENEVLAGFDFYLHDIDFSEVSNNPRFDFEFSLSKPDKKKALYFELQLKLKGKQIFKKIEDILLNNKASFFYELFTQYPDKKQEERVDLMKLNGAGFKVYEIDKAKDFLPPARSVIDLHIDKLIDNPKKLKPGQILDIQMKEFEKYVDLALAHRQPYLTVIHGIGEGILRNEIHQNLKNRKEVKSFVNQYNPSYGFGATEIIFNFP